MCRIAYYVCLPCRTHCTNLRMYCMPIQWWNSFTILVYFSTKSKMLLRYEYVKYVALIYKINVITNIYIYISLVSPDELVTTKPI